MPLSQLDLTAALIVIDMQKGVVSLPTAHPIGGVVENVVKLARAFRARGLPVILVNVAGRAPGRVESAFNFSPPPDWTDLIPELDRQPGDYTVTKMNVGAFHGTALEQILRRNGVTQVVIVGVATGSGVEATARQAYDQGYHVVAVTDAMTDLDPDMHRHAVDKVFARIGERAVTAEVVEKLKPR
ncbi:MAG TPA: isochorismatase family cysteine hydrolase [Steroidobacteraceae bacterium]